MAAALTATRMEKSGSLCALAAAEGLTAAEIHKSQAERVEEDLRNIPHEGFDQDVAGFDGKIIRGQVGFQRQAAGGKLLI